MLRLAILGFLAGGPLHGYELRSRIARLSGHARPVSDGSLYPAIDRLVAAGLVRRDAEPGIAGANRLMLRLTEAGRTELRDRLRHPSDVEISDGSRFFTVLAFLSELPKAAERNAVLRRRLDFLAAAPGFFTEQGAPVTEERETDPYRRGMLRVAKAANRAERAWLTELLADEPDRRRPGR